MTTSTKVIAEANKYLGAKEGSAQHKALIDIYNATKPLPRSYAVSYTDAWCMAFVRVAFINAGALSLIHGGECSCQRMIELFRNNGQYTSNSTGIATGDVVFYDWNADSWSDHVGIVTGVSGSKITVIEGNYSDQVKFRTLEASNSTIQGYARPAYEAKPEEVKKSNEEVATEVLAGVYGNGEERAEKLEAAGYDYKTIQALVNSLIASTTETKKTNEEVAIDVLAGMYGNGDARKKAVEADGYCYEEVQAIVNKLTSKKSNDVITKEVVAGKWGNNPERAAALKEAGYDAAAIQKLVNKLVD